MPTLYWSVAGVSDCQGSTNYPNNADDGIFSLWQGSTRGSSGNTNFNGATSLATPGTYTFVCTNTGTGASDSATLTVTDCPGGTTWNGSSCASNPSSTPSGSISAPSCVVPVGQSSCQTTFTWTTSNFTNPTVGSCANQCTEYLFGTVSGASGNQIANIKPSGAYAELRNNGTVYTTATVAATCASGSTWNGSSCASSSGPIPSPTNLAASCNPQGNYATLTWSDPAGYNRFYTRISENGTQLTSNPMWNDDFGGTVGGLWVTPGSSYYFWIHSRAPSGAYSDPPTYITFSCGAPATPSGTITISPCTVPTGQSSCATTLSWTSNGIGSITTGSCGYTGSGYTGTCSVGTFPNGSGANGSISGTITPNGAYAELRSNGGAFTSTTNAASCQSGSTWNGSICQGAAPTSCPVGQYLSNGACYTIPPVTNFTAACNPSGTSATFSWTAPSGFNTFFTRASNSSGLMGAPATDDSFVGTSKTFTTVPGQTYNVWVHTRDTSVNPTWNYSVDVGMGFTCPVPASSGSISAPPCTVPAGQSSCQTTLSWSSSSTSNVTIAACGYTGSGYTGTCSIGVISGTPTGISGSTVATITPNGAYAEARNNGTAFTSTTFAAVCQSGSTWNGSICVPANSASCTISPIAQVTAGSPFTAQVQVTNTGGNVWTSAANYNLGSADPRDNFTFGSNRTSLPSTTGPGSVAYFNVPATAPTTPGTYTFGRQMVQDGVEWFGGTCSQTVTVVANPTGTISAPSCTVPAGAGSCATTFTWSTSNATNPSAGACTNNCSVSLFERTGASGTQNANISPNNSYAEVRSNGVALASMNVTATCASGTTWNGSICACPANYEYYNGTCQPVPPPTNITASCNANGTTGTFSWTAPAGHNTFYTRAYIAAENTYLYPATDENFVGTSKSFSTVPGKTYNVWVHTKDPVTGAYSNAISANFTCSNPAPLVSVSPTNTGMNLGSSANFTVTSADNAPDITMDTLNWITPGVAGWNWENGSQGATVTANSNYHSNGYASFPATQNRTTVYSFTPDRAGVYTYYVAALDNGGSRWTTAGNYTITVCGTTQEWNGSTCVNRICTNGATNYPTCSTCPVGYSMQAGVCSANPIGNYDSISCSVASGWTCDPSDWNQQIPVHFYEGGTYVGATTANVAREPGVGAACGNGTSAHGFTFNLPDSLKTGTARNITAYSINIGAGTSNPSLGTRAMPAGCYPAATASITASPCTIAAGAASCPVNVSWTSANIQNGPQFAGCSYTAPGYTGTCTVGFGGQGGASGTFTGPLSGNGTYMHVYDANNTIYTSRQLTGICTAGSSWNGSICACPGGQEAYNGSCRDIPLPTNLTASCDANGTTGTFSWTKPAGNYVSAPRGYDNAAAVYLYPPTNDWYTGTSISFSTTPGKSYGVWVHLRDTVSGNWGNAVSATITCTNNAPTISMSPTNTGMNLGNSMTYTVISSDSGPDITMDTVNWTTPGISGWNWENNGQGATVRPNANYSGTNGYASFPAVQNRTTTYTFTPDRAGVYNVYSAALDNGGSRWTQTSVYTLTVCGATQEWNGAACVNRVCANGATNYPTCTICPAGQAVRGGTCQNLVAPTGLTASCSANGDTGTFSWTAPAGETTFYTRASTGGVNLGSPAWDDNFVGTSKSFTTTPGSSYNVWVHTKDPTSGNWSSAPSASFICQQRPFITSAVVNINDCTSPNITLSCSDSNAYQIVNTDTGTTVATGSSGTGSVNATVPITTEGNYSITCSRGALTSPAVIRSYSSNSCTPRNLTLLASPRTIRQGGSAVLTWSLLYPNNSCSLTAQAVCPNGASSCPGAREDAATALNSRLTSENTDANDPNGSRGIQASTRTELPSSNSGAGKKTLQINYTTDFMLRCTGATDARTRIQISTENEG